MRPVVSLTTLVAFLIHFGLGCGAHHTHAATELVCAGYDHLAIEHSHHGHEHRHDDSANNELPENTRFPSHPHNDHNDCHENHCSFTAGVGISPVDNLVVANQALCVADSLAKPSGWESAQVWFDVHHEIHLPARYHLVHQCFLN